jgi:hypothetical protein
MIAVNAVATAKVARNPTGLQWLQLTVAAIDFEFRRPVAKPNCDQRNFRFTFPDDY